MNTKLSLVVGMIDRLTAPFASMTSRATAAVERTEAAIGKLANQSAAVAGFRTLKTETTRTAEAWQTAQARVAQLARELAASEAPTKKQAAALEAARRAAAAAKDQHERVTMRLEHQRRALHAAGLSTATLGAAQRANATATAGLNAQLERQRTNLERLQAVQAAGAKFGDSLPGGGALAGTLAGAGAAYGVASAVKGTAGFDAELQHLANIADLADEKIAPLRARLLQISHDAYQARDGVLTGMQTLVGAGMSADAATVVLEPIARAAFATRSEVDDLSKTVWSMNDALDVAPTETTRALDMLALAGKRGNFELSDMAQHFPALTAQARALGLRGAPGVATLAASLQIARKGAADASTAANNLQNFMAKLTAPDTVRNFDKLGISVEDKFKEAVAAGKDPIIEMIKLIQDVTGGDKFRIGELFGDMQVKAFIDPMLANMAEFETMRTEIMDARGVVDADFRKMSRTTEASMTRTGESLTRLGDSIAKAIEPVVVPVIDFVGRMAAGAADLADRFPAVTSMVVGFVGVLIAGKTALAAWSLGSAVLSLLGGRFTLLSSVGGGAVGMLRTLGGWLLTIARVAFPAVVTGLRILGAAFMANPIGLLIGAIALAAGLIYEYWEPISEFFSGLWDGIKAVFAPAVDWLSTVVLAPIMAIKDAIGAAWDAVFGDDSASAEVTSRIERIDETVRPEETLPAVFDTASGSVTATSSTSAVFNIYAQPGQDARAIAQEVHAMLQRDNRRALYDAG